MQALDALELKLQVVGCGLSDVGKKPNVGLWKSSKDSYIAISPDPSLRIVEFGKQSDMIYIRYVWYKRTSFVSERQIV